MLSAAGPTVQAPALRESQQAERNEMRSIASLYGNLVKDIKDCEAGRWILPPQSGVAVQRIRAWRNLNFLSLFSIAYV